MLIVCFFFGEAVVRLPKRKAINRSKVVESALRGGTYDGPLLAETLALKKDIREGIKLLWVELTRATALLSYGFIVLVAAILIFGGHFVGAGAG